MCIPVMRVRSERARAMLRCACALALVALVTADDKRGESEFMSPMPFVLGSRYGRSQPRLISPRNDRFFMGSRYGKRSEGPLTPPLPPLPPPGTSSGIMSSDRSMICEPAGFYSLYRCTPAPPRNYLPYNNRRSDENHED